MGCWNVILVELDYQEELLKSQKLKKKTANRNKLSVSRFPILLYKRIDKEAKWGQKAKGKKTSQWITSTVA
jgi:hypothetical protein